MKRLVYYEHHDDIRDVIKREKQRKWWKRQWKLELIEGMNLRWRDRYSDIVPTANETEQKVGRQSAFRITGSYRNRAENAPRLANAR